MIQTSKGRAAKGRIPMRLLAMGAAGLIAGAMPWSAALAQTAGSPGGVSVTTTGHPQRDTLLKLQRRMTVEFRDQRLEDVLRFIAEFTGADMEVMWRDERNEAGLEQDATISLDAKNLSALTVLERVLDKATSDDGENTWQMSKTGEIQVGPKERLNRHRRVEIYDIYDMLLEIQTYDEVPTIDLQTALQQSQGGGGQSPFEDDESDDEADRLSLDDRAQEVISIVTELVEFDQWQVNGGDAATIRHFRGTLIVNAPDYVHRQLAGYPYWPANMTRVSMQNGRRWVSLGVDTGVNRIDGFGREEVSAVVNGEVISSGGPGGGG